MESSGKIFLADQRGLTEQAAVKRYSTFNFEKYYSEHQTAQGDLFLFNDEFLGGSKLSFFLSKADAFQVFIPITGGIDIVAGSKEFSAATGQVLILNLEKGEVLEISNPYKEDVVNYIQLGLYTDNYIFNPRSFTADFDFQLNPNQLISIIDNQKIPFKLSAGIFAGQKEAIYKMQDPANNFYAFIVDGAFEIQGRLMHARDGLALWSAEQVELEALSNNAIVFVLEYI